MKVQREQLETLPVAQLKEIAKANDIKGVTTLKKAELDLQRRREKTGFRHRRARHPGSVAGWIRIHPL